MSNFFLDNAILLTSTSVTNIGFGLVAFVVGCAVFLKNKRGEANQLFFLVALNICVWTFSSTLADVFRTAELALIWTRLAIVGPFFLTSFFLLFSYYFPKRLESLTAKKGLLILAPSLLILPFVPTGYNVASVTLEYWGTNFVPGPLYSVLFVHILANYALAARNFTRTYRATKDELVRRQIMFLYLGMILMVASGVVTNLILPLVFSYSKASVIGPASSAFFVVLVMYAMLRHGLMDVKIIATETFSSVLVFISLIEVFFSDSVADFFLNGGKFAVTALFAALLIRRINADERQKLELQALTQELALANERLKETDKLKSEFVSIASHQLRTPISVIKGYLSLILEGAYGPVQGQMKDKVAAMVEMSERLAAMVSEMLNVSRIERNKIAFTCAQADLVETARMLVAEMQMKAVDKGMTVKLVAEQGPALAVVDNDKVKEVLSNLIDNAIKYSQKGTVEVVVRARPSRKDVLVTISDEGMGIPPEDAKHMFEKFYRANTPEVSRMAGTGLGLYVCRVFIRGMGGDIWIERTAVGMGTIFAFSLPMDATGECAPKTV